MFHRKNIRLAIIAVLLLATGKYNSIAQSTKDAVVVDVADINKLRLAVEKSPNNIEAHEAYIKALGFSKWGAPDNPELVKQYEEWMKKFPNSAVVPYALGHAYIGKESPKAKPYLLKAVEIDPKFDKAWYDLFSDAQRWGNEEKGREYLAKAVAANPKDASLAFAYASSFKEVDS